MTDSSPYASNVRRRKTLKEEQKERFAEVHAQEQQDADDKAGFFAKLRGGAAGVALAAAVRDAQRQGAALRQFHRVLKIVRGRPAFIVLMFVMAAICVIDATLQYVVVQFQAALLAAWLQDDQALFTQNVYKWVVASVAATLSKCVGRYALCCLLYTFAAGLYPANLIPL